MRSPKQIAHRLRQEINNFRLWKFPPSTANIAPPSGPLSPLPSPAAIRELLAGTAFAGNLIGRADRVLQGKYEIFDVDVALRPELAWRRDWINQLETGTDYFRKIPYLNRALAGDHKIVWEPNRHQHLVLLAQAWTLTGDRKYTDEIERQLESWWEQNPFQEGINWTSALEVAFRALSWIWVFHLSGDQLNEGIRRKLLRSFSANSAHLSVNLSRYFSPNTHLLGEAVALHAIGFMFPMLPNAEAHRREGARVVQDAINWQVQDDGYYFEQSSYYHVYALDMFLFHALLERVSDSYKQKLSKMADVLDSLQGPERILPFFGDDDGGRFFHPYGPRDRFGRATLATAAVMLKRNDLPFDREDLHEQATWWLGATEGSGVGRAHSRLLANAGVAVLSNDRVHIVFDAGRFGPWSSGHSHSDSLSFILRIDGREVLLDPGTYTYVGDIDWRNRFRSSAAHNTVVIDGKDQAEMLGPFGWRNQPQVRVIEFRDDYCSGEWRSHDGFTHRRSITLEADQLLIDDEVEGPAGEHVIEQYWHLAEARDATRFTSDIAGELVEGWRSRALNSKEPAPILRFTRRSILPCRFQTTISLQP